MVATVTFASLDDFRAGFRVWLTEHQGELAEFRHRPTDRAELLVLQARYMDVLWESGWKRFGWPEREGGVGGGPLHRAVFYDELTRARLPIPEMDPNIEVMADATRTFAPELAERYLERVYRGVEIWSQGFSEPGAGSDLASLRTRAVRDGDSYLVSGQKVWTSSGWAADRLFVLVRTGTVESRHRGISALLIDADAPGVTVRPLMFASGAREMAECFFDEVRVPLDRLIGAENDGWGVAMYLLQFERGMYAWIRQAHLFGVLQLLADQTTAKDTATQDALGRAYRAVTALRARSLQTVRRLAAGERVGPDASADKILLATAEQLVFDTARELLHPAFEDEAAAELWRHEWWYSRAASIYGGSGEVQRGILADHVLQLPREQSRNAPKDGARS